MIVTGKQIRAARALIGWTRGDLAQAAGLHRNAVAYWEGKDKIPTGRHQEPVACQHIRAALLAAGVDMVTSPNAGVVLCARTNYGTPTRPPARAHQGGIQPSDRCTALSRPLRPAKPDLHLRRGRRCGARTRRGDPCQRKALANGKCRNHGGCSTGPRTELGRNRISEAQRRRWREWRAARSSNS